MLNDKVEKALNAQINAELYSYYLYLSMAAYLKSVDLDGCSSWMEAQALEEQSHAMKIYNFINSRGGRVILTAIDGPETEWDSLQAVFEHTLEHEEKVTGLINELVEVAMTEHDHATTIFLNWFVTEQIEEEETAGGILSQIKLMGESKGALFMLDRELGQRQAPAAETE